MKKIGGLLFAGAVLVALTGCSAPEAKAPVEAAELPTASASTSAAPKAMSLKASAEEAPVNLNEGTEKRFVEFALMRAEMHGVSKKPSEKAIVAALHEFCEDGKSFKLAKSSAYNENMDAIAQDSYCSYLVK